MRAPVSVDLNADIEIDHEGTNKLIDAAADTFSPPTEFLGLLGDSVRLARVGVAVLVTKLAKKIAADNGLELKAPPLRFLAPFYEKASLEDVDDLDAQSRWANLLVGTCASSEEAKPHFVSIMAQLEASQAQLLKQCFSGSVDFQFSNNEVGKILVRESFNAITNRFDLAYCEKLLELIVEDGASLDTHRASFSHFLSGRGIFVSGFSARNFERDLTHLDVFGRRIPNDLDAEVLCALGLCEKQTFRSKMHWMSRADTVEYSEIDIVTITQLGISFVAAFDPEARQYLGSLRV